MNKLRLLCITLAFFTLAVLVSPITVKAETVECRYNDKYDITVSYDTDTDKTRYLEDVWEDVTYDKSKEPSPQNYNTKSKPKSKPKPSADPTQCTVPIPKSNISCYKKEYSCFLVSVKDDQDKEYTRFVVRNENLYILGFKTGNYFYSLKEDNSDFEPQVPGAEEIDLGYNGNYNTIYPDKKRDTEFGLVEIIQELETLRNAKKGEDYTKYQTGIAYAAFFISESLRFHKIYNDFGEIFSSYEKQIKFNADLKDYVDNWSKCSQACFYGNDEQRNKAKRVLQTALYPKNNSGSVNCPAPG